MVRTCRCKLASEPYLGAESMTFIRLLSVLMALLLTSSVTFSAETLYEQIGGRDVLVKAIDELVAIMEEDDRINFTFAETDIPKFKQLLVDQLCEITGGPCKYEGRSMQESHEKMNVDNAMFNALAEDLYIAFDRVKVPYRVQNQVMALLAPMQRDIVK
jgi:hemoglobin